MELSLKEKNPKPNTHTYTSACAWNETLSCVVPFLWQNEWDALPAFTLTPFPLWWSSFCLARLLNELLKFFSDSFSAFCSLLILCDSQRFPTPTLLELSSPHTGAQHSLFIFLCDSIILCCSFESPLQSVLSNLWGLNEVMLRRHVAGQIAIQMKSVTSLIMLSHCVLSSLLNSQSTFQLPAPLGTSFFLMRASSRANWSHSSHVGPSFCHVSCSLFNSSPDDGDWNVGHNRSDLLSLR